MPNVLVDITGFFFSRSVNVDTDATVRNVMDEVVRTNALVPPTDPLLLYFPDIEQTFLNEILIIHRRGSAKSRQAPQPGAATRQYDNGLFSFSDDQIIEEVGPNGSTRFAPRDPDASLALAWQFYVYKQTPDGLIDLSRSQIGGATRKVDPFTEAKPFADAADDTEFQLVWRLVALALRPNRIDAIQSARVATLLGNTMTA